MGSVCTVLLRFAPGTRWPLLVAAIRDEFVGRSWQPPAAHWPGTPYVGGRDLVAGGTWLAVRPAHVEAAGGPASGDSPALAAVLNGRPLPPPVDGWRPSRGALPLAALTEASLPAGPELARYDRFHLLLGTPDRVDVWTWDGADLTRRALEPGDHILVNDGVDATGDPLVPHFAPILTRTTTPDPRPGLSTADAWGDWLKLLAGDGLAPDDPRALIVRHQHFGREYGSTSATLVALGHSAVRYDFSGDPGPTATWHEIPLTPSNATGPHWRR
jgi:Transport and Golgi organisation 2